MSGPVLTERARTWCRPDARCAETKPLPRSCLAPSLQAYLRMEEINVDVPVQNPDTAVHDTLRAFPSVRHLVFDITPAPAGRTARVKRSGPSRQPSRWPARLARLAVGVAKVVMAVELAAMIRGSGRGVVRQVRRALHGSSEEGGSSEEMGSETEAALEAVGEYVAGRLGLEALQRYPQGVVRAALEAMDTEVMEQVGEGGLGEQTLTSSGATEFAEVLHMRVSPCWVLAIQHLLGRASPRVLAPPSDVNTT